MNNKKEKNEKLIISPDSYREILRLLGLFKKEKHDQETYNALTKSDELIADAVSVLAAIVDKQSEKLKSDEEKEFIKNLSEFVMHYMAGNNVTKKRHEESLQVCYSKIELYETMLYSLQGLLLEDAKFIKLLQDYHVKIVSVTDEGVDIDDGNSVYSLLNTIFNNSNKLKECFTMEDLAQYVKDRKKENEEKKG